MIPKPFAANEQLHAARYQTTHSRVERIAGRFEDDHFTGALLRPATSEAAPAVLQSPLLAAVGALLAPERGFLAAMSEVFETDLTMHLEHLLVIQRLCSSVPFIADAEWRRDVLDAWCADVLDSPGFLVVHPPSTLWQAEDQRARFQLGRHRDNDLELCVLFGSLGFAQICDDLLGHPIPLLVLPWTPSGGPLEPRRLPTKSFSHRLSVKRIGRRRLLLFEKPCHR